MNGGCLCGAVRYHLSERPIDVGICHCRDCQLNSASPALPFANVSLETITITAGEVSLIEFASSENGRRRFCGMCGTPLFAVDLLEPDLIAINHVTLDRPADLPPAFHIYYDSHIPWAPVCDDLPRFARSRSEN